jgi:hypothetical protein
MTTTAAIDHDTYIAILATIVAVVPAERWVSLTTVRPNLAAWTREEQDAALRQIERLADVNLVPESNQKILTAEDRAAAVEIGDQDKHLIWICA